jgi:hypothetical protein
MTAARDEWLAGVGTWLRARVPGVTALEPVSERRWGAVLRVVTRSDRLVFKAVGPLGMHEIGLLVDVAARRAQLAPDLVAVDPDRGWVLMLDHGTRLSEVADIARQVELIEQLLPVYAELQLSTTDRVERWVEAGVPDRSPARLPAMLDDLLAGRGVGGRLPIRVQEIDGMVQAARPFERVCEALDRRAIDHADIHATNVVVDGDGPRLIDWGDACVAHPFTSMLVPIEWIAGRLPAADRPAAVRRLVDAYCEPWGAVDRRELALAVWSGYVARAVLNDQQCDDASPADVADAQGEVVALLRVWRAKSQKLDAPDDLLLPGMPW